MCSFSKSGFRRKKKSKCADKKAIVVIVKCTSKNSKGNYEDLEVSGSQCLAASVLKHKDIILEELNASLKNPLQHYFQSNGTLPPLRSFDDQQVTLKDMDLRSLRNFIPKMIKTVTGQRTCRWHEETAMPVWWPQNVLPWTNVKLDPRDEHEKKKLSMADALKCVIKSCYKYYKCEQNLGIDASTSCSESAVAEINNAVAENGAEPVEDFLPEATLRVENDMASLSELDSDTDISSEDAETEHDVPYPSGSDSTVAEIENALIENGVETIGDYLPEATLQVDEDMPLVQKNNCEDSICLQSVGIKSAATDNRAQTFEDLVLETAVQMEEDAANMADSKIGTLLKNAVKKDTVTDHCAQTLENIFSELGLSLVEGTPLTKEINTEWLLLNESLPVKENIPENFTFQSNTNHLKDDKVFNSPSYVPDEFNANTINNIPQIHMPYNCSDDNNNADFNSILEELNISVLTSSKDSNLEDMNMDFSLSQNYNNPESTNPLPQLDSPSNNDESNSIINLEQVNLFTFLDDSSNTAETSTTNCPTYDDMISECMDTSIFIGNSTELLTDLPENVFESLNEFALNEIH